LLLFGHAPSACANNKIYYWNVAARQCIELEGHKSGGINLTFNPAGDLLASTSWDGYLRLWELSSGRVVFHTPFTGWRVRFSPDGRRLACSLQGTKLRLWNVAAGREYRSLLVTQEFPGCEQAAISPDGCLLATGSPKGFALWDLTRGKELAHLPNLGRCHGVLFEATGAIVTNSPVGVLRWPLRAEPGTERIWRLGPPEALLAPGTDTVIAQSRDSRILAIPYFNQGTRVIDQSRHESKLIPLVPQPDVRTVAVSPDGRWVASATFGTGTGHAIKVWESLTGRLVKALPVDYALGVAFSPDGRCLAIQGGEGGICRVWAVESWVEVEDRQIEGGALAFSPDGRLLAVDTGHGMIRLIDPATRRGYARLEDP